MTSTSRSNKKFFESKPRFWHILNKPMPLLRRMPFLRRRSTRATPPTGSPSASPPTAILHPSAWSRRLRFSHNNSTHTKVQPDLRQRSASLPVPMPPTSPERRVVVDCTTCHVGSLPLDLNHLVPLTQDPHPPVRPTFLSSANALRELPSHRVLHSEYHRRPSPLQPVPRARAVNLTSCHLRFRWVNVRLRRLRSLNRTLLPSPYVSLVRIVYILLIRLKKDYKDSTKAHGVCTAVYAAPFSQSKPNPV